MFTMNVPKYLWGEAIFTTIYLINRMPSKVLNFKTPLAVLNDFFPTTHLSSNLPIKDFCCICYVHLPSHFRAKLDH